MFEGACCYFSSFVLLFISISHLNLACRVFEVVPKRAINVETFAFDMFAGSEVTVQVYTKTGPWSSFESNPGAWTKISEQTKPAVGSSNTVQLAHQSFEAVTIYSGQKQSFYLALQGQAMMVRQGPAGAVANENNDVSVYTGHQKVSLY